MVHHRDTIAAIATPPGRGGIGIVRVSGPEVPVVAGEVLGRVPEPRSAVLLPFLDGDGNSIDRGLALFLPGPRSYTGDDTLELHGHGGPVVLDRVLARVLEAGARMAQPGEFTQQAFLNGRMDLAQAEAVADLIEAASTLAAQGAIRSLEGELSRRVRDLLESLVEVRAFVEAAIDFPEEEIDFLADEAIDGRLSSLRLRLRETLDAAQQGSLLREGMTVVIAGRPNVGKSSLLNRISGRDAAIVTDVPGTTRDVLREQIHVDGLPLHVLDTAGLRATEDRVEKIGVERAWKAMEGADAVLLVVDDRVGVGEEEQSILANLPGSLPVLVVRNKIDLTGARAGVCESEARCEIRVSAKSGVGLEAVKARLKSLVGYSRQSGEGCFTARRRHIEALDAAAAAIDSALAQLRGARAGELVAEDLRQAQRALGAITGEFTTEDLLDRIFSTFCIGK